ncbi:MAG TPA: hypothetical protein VFQ70_04205 [Candidatus Saccharimonadaceae bacterium]|nr:hypothetical protein [Candidatus Saccharimonadaceae bacterium]
MTTNWTVLIFLLAIVIVGILVIGVIMVTKKGERHLDVDKFRSRWLTIEQTLARDEPSSYVLAILEADKLLDMALRERGIAGTTMGERMKAFQARWSDANVVWNAHKLRNKIAHESDFRPNYDEARRALSGFKRGLKDAGAI